MALPETHPVADIWPLMSDTELDALAVDIRVRGQILPIVTIAGLILDGRNRWLACERAGVVPWVESIETDDPDGLAWSLNEHRRHAPDSVRAMAARRRETLTHGGARHGQDANLHVETRADLARQFDVSPRSIASAKVVIDHGDPVIIRAVESGDLAVSLAEKTVRRIEETGRQFQSAGELKTFMRDIWREDHPPAPKPPHDRPSATPAKQQQSHVSVDTFGVVRAVIRHAQEYPMAEAVEQIDKWTRLNILDDLPPAIDYLTNLKVALSAKEE